MRSPTESEYKKLGREVEAELERQLELPPDQRDDVLVAECCETLGLIGELLSEKRKGNKAHAVKGMGFGARIRRIAVAAAAVIALLACGVALADAAGVRAGNLFAEKLGDRISFKYSQQGEGEPIGTSKADELVAPSDELEDNGVTVVCETLEELRKAAGEGFVFPADTMGFAFKTGEVVKYRDGESVVNVTLIDGNKTIKIDEYLFPNGVSGERYSSSRNYFGDYGEPEAFDVKGVQCIGAEGAGNAVLVFHGENCEFAVEGQASLALLKQMLASALT